MNVRTPIRKPAIIPDRSTAPLPRKTRARRRLNAAPRRSDRHNPGAARTRRSRSTRSRPARKMADRIGTVRLSSRRHGSDSMKAANRDAVAARRAASSGFRPIQTRTAQENANAATANAHDPSAVLDRFQGIGVRPKRRPIQPAALSPAARIAHAAPAISM